MDMFTILTFIIVIAALFGYVNTRFIKLPNTIGLMVVTLVFTLLVLALSFFDNTLLIQEKALISQIDFQSVLLDVMLSFLLFAGALHTNFDQLKIQRYPILIFASISTLLSTFLIGTFCFYLFKLIGFDILFINCLLFGALISPTDPIAVLGILKKAGVPKKLETKIVGESLFNDGVGVVIFITIYQIAKGSTAISVGHIAELFLVEVAGGVLLGLALGWLTYRLLKSIDDYDTEVIITIATVMGGTILAHNIHVSAPLAMVTAGLFIGNDRMRETAMSETTERYVDKFWELVDVLLNTILFVLIGLEMLVLTFNKMYIIAGVITIPLLLIARYLSLYFPIRYFDKKLDFVPNTNIIMTWGGLRGGISIALALSLTTVMNRELFLVVTYIIVIFSIVVQGLSLGKVVKKLVK